MHYTCKRSVNDQNHFIAKQCVQNCNTSQPFYIFWGICLINNYNRDRQHFPILLDFTILFKFPVEIWLYKSCLMPVIINSYV